MLYGFGPALQFSVENGTKKPLVSSGIIPADITYEFLDILSLGISVHGTGILADRKPLGSCKGCDVSFLSK